MKHLDRPERIATTAYYETDPKPGTLRANITQAHFPVEELLELV